MKTEQDRIIDAALEAYKEHFGKPYPLGMTHSPAYEEVLMEIGRAIRTNT